VGRARRFGPAAGAGALASVEIEIAGVVFVLHGVRVIKTGPRQRGIAAPAHRVANGRLADTIAMPPELARAIANAVLDEYDTLRHRPPPVPIENRPAAIQGWPKRHTLLPSDEPAAPRPSYAISEAKLSPIASLCILVVPGTFVFIALSDLS
jgi:DNA-binding cell septation regulator SpoVG